MKVIVHYSGTFTAEIDPADVAKRAKRTTLGDAIEGALEEAFTEEFRNLVPDIECDDLDEIETAAAAIVNAESSS